ncbi:EsaB/YukD family protein [Dactylosporangium sp. CA-233914]|uniref:EsaB/YukD family protein n=1 Tax=Dactylosporangium sp. CA-233914 TaxID=3239934 RepID=UPI003D92DF1F
MSNEQSRITVVGTRRRIDVSVPSGAPVGEYTAQLASICRQEQADVLPPTWSLAPAGQPPFPLDASLLDQGVIDGQVLYLRDVAGESYAAPLVEEIEEVVADEARHYRQQRLRGGPVVLGLGLLWLTAAAVLAARRFDGGTGVVAGFTIVGMLLLATAWGLAQQRAVVPDALRLAVGLASLPCLAAAGMLVAQVLGAPASRWAGALVGASLAALMMLGVIPNAGLFAVQLQITVALVLVSLAQGLDADPAEAAALVVVTSLGIFAVARRIAATVASWGRRRPPDDAVAVTVTSELVDRSRRVLTVVLAGPAVALAVALPVLAWSGRTFALALVGVACIALVARCRLAAFSAELLAFGSTAAIGCFSLVAAAARLAAPGTAVNVLVMAGLLVVATGVGISALRPTVPEPPDADGTTGPRPARRRSRAEVVGVVASVFLAPLALGVFGAFHHLIDVGRNLF